VVVVVSVVLVEPLSVFSVEELFVVGVLFLFTNYFICFTVGALLKPLTNPSAGEELPIPNNPPAVCQTIGAKLGIPIKLTVAVRALWFFIQGHTGAPNSFTGVPNSFICLPHLLYNFGSNG